MNQLKIRSSTTNRIEIFTSVSFQDKSFFLKISAQMPILNGKSFPKEKPLKFLNCCTLDTYTYYLCGVIALYVWYSCSYWKARLVEYLTIAHIVSYEYSTPLMCVGSSSYFLGGSFRHRSKMLQYCRQVNSAELKSWSNKRNNWSSNSWSFDVGVSSTASGYFCRTKPSNNLRKLFTFIIFCWKDD